MTARFRVARTAGKLAGWAARHAGGRGTVMPGATILKLDPTALATLLGGRRACFVSGTNGKTTTTALIAAANGNDTVTNSDGANLPAGWVTALLDADPRAPAVLEVDEAYLSRALQHAPAAVCVLLNLTRDQLDRHHETRQLAQRWRDALENSPDAPVVANADDPLVVFAAGTAKKVTWVEGGAAWRDDATTCPACGALLAHEGNDWSCPGCGLHRPTPDITQDIAQRVQLSLPGRANRANLAMAAGAAVAMGLDLDRSLAAMANVRSVSGRYARHRVDGHEITVLLAKNPAGWIETLDVINQLPGTVVVAINAQGPDGRDPSWLWDVPFEQLATRTVVATGERATDLAVRLDCAGVTYTKDTRDPLVAATHADDTQVIVAATYTNFLTISRQLARRDD